MAKLGGQAMDEMRLSDPVQSTHKRPASLCVPRSRCMTTHGRPPLATHESLVSASACHPDQENPPVMLRLLRLNESRFPWRGPSCRLGITHPRIGHRQSQPDSCERSLRTNDRTHPKSRYMHYDQLRINNILWVENELPL